MNVFSTFLFVVLVYSLYYKSGLMRWLITCVLGEMGRSSSLNMWLSLLNSTQTSCILVVTSSVVSLLRDIFLKHSINRQIYKTLFIAPFKIFFLMSLTVL